MCDADGHAHRQEGAREISSGELARILAESRLIHEEATTLGGPIRILDRGGRILFQEHTPEGRILIRRCDGIETAEALLRSRVDAYERMWDGCGCHIDYDR